MASIKRSVERVVAVRVAAMVVMVVAAAVVVVAAAAAAAVVTTGKFVPVHAKSGHIVPLDEISGQLHSAARLYLRKGPAQYTFNVRLGGPQSGLEPLERVKCLATVGNRITIYRLSNPYPGHSMSTLSRFLYYYYYYYYYL